MRTGYVRGPDQFKFELPVHPGFHRIYTVFTVIGNLRRSRRPTDSPPKQKSRVGRVGK